MGERDDLKGREGCGMYSRHAIANLHGLDNNASWALSGEGELRGCMIWALGWMIWWVV